MAKKTLTLRRPGAGLDASENAADVPAEGANANPPPATMGSMGGHMAPQGKSPSYTAAAICGIVAVILMGALLALQLAESSYYKGAIPLRSAMIPAP